MSVNKSLITNTIKPVSDEEKQMAKSKGERDKRIERYLEALTTLSKRDPDAFESMAPTSFARVCGTSEEATLISPANFTGGLNPIACGLNLTRSYHVRS